MIVQNNIALQDQQEADLVRRLPRILSRLKTRLQKSGFTPEESLYLCGVVMKENPCLKSIGRSDRQE